MHTHTHTSPSFPTIPYHHHQSPSNIAWFAETLSAAAAAASGGSSGGGPAIRLHVHATRVGAEAAAEVAAVVEMKVGRPDLRAVLGETETDAGRAGRGVAVVGCGPGPMMLDLEARAQACACVRARARACVHAWGGRSGWGVGSIRMGLCSFFLRGGEGGEGAWDNHPSAVGCGAALAGRGISRAPRVLQLLISRPGRSAAVTPADCRPLWAGAGRTEMGWRERDCSMRSGRTPAGSHALERRKKKIFPIK